ncbi:MAG TPA: hypothetical protein VJB59_01785 [Bdellovibrionota bacterium]|nr:hypothetical protein [Bdellovibrionota bacterium]
MKDSRYAQGRIVAFSKDGRVLADIEEDGANTDPALLIGKRATSRF